MKYFEKYKSNTLAGISNQSLFETDNKDCEYTGRAFYRLFAGGTYNYSFLFSNMTIPPTEASAKPTRQGRAGQFLIWAYA